MQPFTNRRASSVAALGEEKLIVAIRGWLGRASPAAPFGIGDDCAVLPALRGKQLITVDPVIYGRHFDASVRPEEAGAKLLKRNLSDIAAMGGRPVAAVVALMLDQRVKLTWLEKFYRGLAATARNYRVPIVGGDIAQAEGTLAATLTLVGEITGPRALTRVGARVGDWIYVTGELGASVVTRHHFRFTPRLREGAWLATRREVRAMMDVSDGLAKDLRALCPIGAVPALDPGALPRRRRADLTAALTEGEDYELLFAVAARVDHDTLEQAWRRAFPRVRLSRIGRFVPVDAIPAGAVNLAAYRGYEHLR
jgi:thiamine-monophosphate kinase